MNLLKRRGNYEIIKNEKNFLKSASYPFFNSKVDVLTNFLFHKEKKNYNPARSEQNVSIRTLR